MEYKIVPPPQALQHLVKYFWALKIDARISPVAIRTFVDDSSGIILHSQHESSSAVTQGQRLPPYMIYGQATTPSLTHVNGEFFATGVLFHPKQFIPFWE